MKKQVDLRQTLIEVIDEYKEQGIDILKMCEDAQSKKIRGDSVANEENLRPFNTMSEEEHKELSRKGGKASGEAKRKRKSIRECLEYLLEQDESEYLLERGVMSGIEAMCYGIYRKAVEGDIRAFITVRDSIGEKPVNKINVSEVDPKIVKEVEELIEEEFSEEKKA